MRSAVLWLILSLPGSFHRTLCQAQKRVSAAGGCHLTHVTFFRHRLSVRVRNFLSDQTTTQEYRGKGFTTLTRAWKLQPMYKMSNNTHTTDRANHSLNHCLHCCGTPVSRAGSCLPGFLTAPGSSWFPSRPPTVSEFLGAMHLPPGSPTGWRSAPFPVPHLHSLAFAVLKVAPVCRLEERACKSNCRWRGTLLVLRQNVDTAFSWTKNNNKTFPFKKRHIKAPIHDRKFPKAVFAEHCTNQNFAFQNALCYCRVQ